jgi:hypothetical protein
MTAAARFKQSDVTRALRGARLAGFAHVRVGIDARGNIVVDASETPVAAERRNPLDRLLDQ